MKRILFALCLVMVVPICGSVQAQVPGTLTYQGYLVRNGVPVSSNKVELVFTIYDAATDGKALWSEDHLGQDAVQVTDGYFTATLGKVKSLTTPPGFFYEQSKSGTAALFLEVTVLSVNGELFNETLSPRTAITSVPFALVCQDALRIEGKSFGERFADLMSLGTSTIKTQSLTVDGKATLTQGVELSQLTYTGDDTGPNQELKKNEDLIATIAQLKADVATLKSASKGTLVLATFANKDYGGMTGTAYCQSQGYSTCVSALIWVEIFFSCDNTCSNVSGSCFTGGSGALTVSKLQIDNCSRPLTVDHCADECYEVGNNQCNDMKNLPWATGTLGTGKTPTGPPIVKCAKIQ